jgi:hypothetical protein
VPARLIAPSLGAVNACCVEGEGTPYLQAGQLLANISYRYLHSFREFHGSEEVSPVPNFLFAETWVNGFDLSLAYQVTSRLSFTLEIPIQEGVRKSYYEHDLTKLTHAYNMRASGVGDLRLVANVWLFDCEKHHDGNISLGLGVKIPTGNDNATDFSHRATGLVLRPVDPAIQPGDGGWGIVTEIAAFQRLYKNTYAYLQGVYLMNPRELNGVQQTTGDEPDFTGGIFGFMFNSVPDQYLGRGGFGYLIWPKMGMSLSLGARIEGIPVHDLIGGDRGWRSPGYAIYIEPGLSVSKGRFSVSVTGPVAVERHVYQNTTELSLSKQLGMNIGGFAAFADYLITASVSVAF